jgi:hypothetical protein
MIARRIRVYGDRDHLEVAGTTALNDILAGLWSTDAGIPLGGLADICREVFEPAQRPEQADLYLLSLKWNSYVESRRVDLAVRASRRAESAHKPFVIFSAGDSPANVPVANAVVFETSGYRSRIGERGNRLFALPAFIPDYVRLYSRGELRLRPKAEKPVVGFCG